MGIRLQLSMPRPFQLWVLIYSLYGSQLIPKKKALLYICISQVITPTRLQRLSQSNKWLIFEYINLIQNVIKITAADYVLKAVCVCYIYLKTVISRIILFVRQQACEDQSILPAYGISGVWLYCTWEYQHILSIFLLIMHSAYVYHFANTWMTKLLLQETCILTYVQQKG